jgi:peptidoglycan/LPS O-acetylase OafA/YrhL
MQNNNFRHDINGLRAIAVIAVVLFHFNASWMPGGFAGVDVFFVISGFLMTGIVFRGIEQENFSILKFYVARANRIIPALAVLCLVLLVFGWFYLTPLDYKALGKHAASSVAFLSNIIYWRESGYFDAASHEKWLLHTWSLSVEWQFYILYPLVLVAMRKFMSIKTMKFLLLVGTVLGFVFCVIATYKWPNPSYYLLPTRAWEMMLGGIAYLYPLTLQENRKKLFEWTGLGLIIGSYFLISSENPWPGYLAIFPVLGSFLLIQANRNNSIITNNFIFQKLGTWSYSIYLWHWPIVVVIYTFSLSELYTYLGVILSIILGFLSYQYVEKIKFSSYQEWKNICRIKPFYISLFLMALGVLIYSFNGFNIDMRQGASSEKAKFLNYYEVQHRNLDEAYWLKCNTYTSLNDHNTYDTDPICVTKQNNAGGVFLWGDSHAEALSLGLRTLLKTNNIPFYQKTSAGCRASLTETTHQKGIFKQACDHSNQLALKSISEIKPSIVIIAQANKHNETNWNNITKKLLDLGVSSVILVGPVSQWKPSLPRVIIKPKNWNNTENFISDPGLDLDLIELDKKMKDIKYSDRMKYISLIDHLCQKDNLNNQYKCRVRATKGEDLLQVDYGHLSESGSLFVVKTIFSNQLLDLYEKNNQIK